MGATRAGIDALYAHLGAATPSLPEGRRILAAGGKLGVVGHSGGSYGAQLYFRVAIDGARVDPAPLLGVRLCG